MQLDPHRPDALMWITSYASIFHRPGTPLYDLTAIGRAGRDPRMYFSWYGADYCTDPAFADATPEDKANPSRGTWADPHYLTQQAARLPAHKFRRLHLNLPGLPAGSAFDFESILSAVAIGIPLRLPELGLQYFAFVDMSGGSDDDAVLCIGYRDADGRAVICRLESQGQPPPFDPSRAVARFVKLLKEYGVYHVIGDRYAGLTFQCDFEEKLERHSLLPGWPRECRGQPPTYG